MGEHLYTFVDPPNPRHLERIVDVLQRGGVIAMPAGTNWVLAAEPSSRKAIARIRALKPEHPADRPFSLLCADIATATTVATIDGRTYKLVRRLWPGPYTVLLKAGPKLPRLLATKRKVVGIRVPEDPLATTILRAYGGPLMVSTVPDAPDGQRCTMGYEVYDRLGDRLDMVVDLGEALPATETTVLDLSGGTLEIVREGAGPLDVV